MDFNELRPGIMLSVQRAFLGEITDKIRCIAVEGIYENNILINVYIEGTAKENFRENMSCVETEVISDYTEIPIKLDIHEETEGEAVKDILKGDAVFWRKE